MLTDAIEHKEMLHQDQQAIRKLIEETYPGNVKSNNGAGYAKMYMQDALWMPPDAPDFRGTREIEDEITNRLQQFSITPTITAEEIEIVTPDFAYAIGLAKAVLKPRNGSESMSLTFRPVWLLRKQDGAWKIARQIWNVKP